MTQLDMLPDAVVAPSEGLIWCPTAKAGTTSILALLNRKKGEGEKDTEESRYRSVRAPPLSPRTRGKSA